MGDYRRVTFIVMAGLLLMSIGFIQESLAYTKYVKTIYIPSYQLIDFLRLNGIESSQDIDNYQENKPQPKQSSTPSTSELNNDVKKSKDYSHTRPTFGLGHGDSDKAVDYGFQFNGKSFSVSDNYHTPFSKQPIKLGEVNTFGAKVLAEKKLKIQEFLFGIPDKGEGHLAEMGIEVWYDLFGEIQDVKVIQKSNVIDPDTITVTHEKVKCTSSDSKKSCDLTNVEVVFLEPLRDSVMAIKAIDYKNRYQITYLNDGFDISGNSLNPMPVMMIPSPVKNEGLIPVTQTSKYSSLWITEDDRIFEKNRFDSFKQIHHKFERFQDSGEANTRLHSGFGGVLEYEQMRATELFNSTKLISELPETFAYKFDDTKIRIDATMKQKMKVEESRAFEIISQMRDFIHSAPLD